MRKRPIKPMDLNVVLFLVLSLAAVPGAAQPPAWRPEKNIEIISTSGAGGGIDLTARTIQKLWQEKRLLDVTASVSNRTGGGGAVAWNYLNQQGVDGHMLALAPLNLLTNRIMGGNPLTYTDVTPIALLLEDYAAFSVNPDSPIRTGTDLIERLKKGPASVTVAVNALGAGIHIAAGVIFKAAGVDVKNVKFVVFKSSAESVTALLGNHVDMIMSTVPPVLGPMQAGRLRIVGISAPQRLGGALAGIPTWKEYGVDASFANWRGVVGARALNFPQIAYWDDVFGRLTKTAEWHKELEKHLQQARYLNSGEFRKFLEVQSEQLRDIIAAMGFVRQP